MDSVVLWHEDGGCRTVSFGDVQFFHKPHGLHTTSRKFSITGVKELPRVDIVYACADMSTDLMDIMVKAGAKGIVIAGVGDGNMNAGTLEAVKNERAWRPARTQNKHLNQAPRT